MLIVYPRFQDHTDYGVEYRVLARYGLKELWYIPGHSTYQRYVRMERNYHRATLCLAEYEDKGMKRSRSSDWKIWTSRPGVRLTKKVFLECRDRINGFFGVPLAQHLDPEKTLILDGINFKESSYHCPSCLDGHVWEKTVKEYKTWFKDRNIVVPNAKFHTCSHCTECSISAKELKRMEEIRLRTGEFSED